VRLLLLLVVLELQGLLVLRHHLLLLPVADEEDYLNGSD
jgi:hypothetical protein